MTPGPPPQQHPTLQLQLPSTHTHPCSSTTNRSRVCVDRRHTMETSNPCTAQSPRPCGTQHRREVTPGGVISVQQISSPKSMNCFLSVSRLHLSLECRWCCARSDLHGFLHVDNRSHKHAHETTGGLGPGLSAWRDASLNKAALKSTSEGASIDHGF